MFFFFITILIFCGLFLYFVNLEFMKFLPIFKLMLIPNLSYKSNSFNVIMGVNNSKLFHKFFVSWGIILRFFFVLKVLLKMASSRERFVPSTILFVPLCHASLTPYFWPHALNTATYLLNILSSKLLGHLTPTHFLYHKTPSYDHLRVFGCLCFPLISSTKIYKLQPRSSPCVFLGYLSSHRGYKCYDIASRKILISCNVIFDETVFSFFQDSKRTLHEYEFLDDPNPYFFLHHSQPSSNIPSPNPNPSPTRPHLPNGPTSSPHQQTPSSHLKTFLHHTVQHPTFSAHPYLHPLPLLHPLPAWLRVVSMEFLSTTPKILLKHFPFPFTHFPNHTCPL